MTDSEDRTVCLDFESGIERELDQAYRDLGKHIMRGDLKIPSLSCCPCLTG